MRKRAAERGSGGNLVLPAALVALPHQMSWSSMSFAGGKIASSIADIGWLPPRGKTLRNSEPPIWTPRAYRNHLQLDIDEPQVLDGSRRADASVTDIGRRLMDPFDVGLVERVFQRPLIERLYSATTKI